MPASHPRLSSTLTAADDSTRWEYCTQIPQCSVAPPVPPAPPPMAPPVIAADELAVAVAAVTHAAGKLPLDVYSGFATQLSDFVGR